MKVAIKIEGEWITHSCHDYQLTEAGSLALLDRLGVLIIHYSPTGYEAMRPIRHAKALEER